MNLLKINKSKLFEKRHRQHKLFEDEFVKRDIKFIVLHHTQADSIEEAIDLYKEPGVSAHYVIDESGVIFLLVAEENIAFHAGYSFWNGFYALNQSSIGIEFLNKDPYKINYSKKQMQSACELLHYLCKKYNIEQKNIVGHSDIAHFDDTKLLGRKDDPSYLFDWSFLAKNNIGIFPEISVENDKILYEFGQNHHKISIIKKDLRYFGY